MWCEYFLAACDATIAILSDNWLWEGIHMAMGEIQRSAILSAIAEFDVLGREEFLKRYGFGKARNYFLVHDGKYYDSKAIVGVAHRYQFPQAGILTSDDFSGGDATVKTHLEKLGFKVEVRNISSLQ
jgi:hypothetical protein